MKKPSSVPTPMAQKALYLSHFTPSMMQPETLQQMLVQRQPLLDACYDDVVHSVTTSSKHHYLFVGPRGIGKTHLISLLYHRLSTSKEVRKKGLIAWMREEEWGVTSFFELVLRILRTLDQQAPELGIATRTAPLYELTLKQAEAQGSSLLLDVLSEKTLIVLFENLDDLFDQLGDAGQRQLRAFIQNHPQLVLVATTPALFAGVSLQKSPFYGFFDIQPLKEFSLDDVVDLLKKIATERGDTALADFIETPEGRARIRAVHHLAEGNPRIYVIFAQFLSREALDELVQAVTHTLDELTPYYQARMKELSGQQRKIVEYLVNYRGAAPVKQIAKACFITHQTCSGQLKQLREKRYVRSVELGRESYYELTEPLMRLCMEVKQQRGEPIGLFVEILRIWYTEAELSEWLASPPSNSRLSLRYVQHALELVRQMDGAPEPIFQAQIDAIAKLSRQQDIAGVTRVLDEMIAMRIVRRDVQILRALTALNWLLIEPTFSSRVIPRLPEFKEVLADGVKSLSRPSTGLINYGLHLNACLGLMTVDSDGGQQALDRLAPHLLERPAPAAAAILNGMLSSLNVLELSWLHKLLDHLTPHSRFRTVMNRMSSSAAAWLETGDEKRLLDLGREERELVKRALYRIRK